jgi:hypothetical protein
MRIALICLRAGKKSIGTNFIIYVGEEYFIFFSVEFFFSSVISSMILINFSIGVINGSLPTREVYQYNHRWSAAHIDVKFLLWRLRLFRLLSSKATETKLREKMGKQCFLWTSRSNFRFLQFNRADWSANNLANKPGFKFIDLFIANNHLECVVGSYFIKFVHENFHRFEFKENNLFLNNSKMG